MRLRIQRAFTLVEVLVVVVILGALAAIALPAYQDYVERTRVGAAIQDIAAISTKLEFYYEDNRQYPPSLNLLGTPPLDPWGRAYQYLPIDIDPPPNIGQLRKDKHLNPLNSDFDLYSMGRDGVTAKPLTSARSRDDVVRADNGRFVGLGRDH